MTVKGSACCQLDSKKAHQIMCFHSTLLIISRLLLWWNKHTSQASKQTSDHIDTHGIRSKILSSLGTRSVSISDSWNTQNHLIKVDYKLRRFVIKNCRSCLIYHQFVGHLTDMQPTNDIGHNIMYITLRREAASSR